jgi:type I restriction enzyme S subunit
LLAEGVRYTTGQLIDAGVLAIGDGYRAKNSELASDGLPFARAGNIDGGLNFDGADHFPEKNLGRVGEKVSRPSDVVFTSKGTVGRFAFVTERTPRFVYSPQLCYWRSLQPSMLQPRFLYYWMHGIEFWEQANGLKGQTDMADYVSLGDQRRMHITLPSLPEQEALAEILGVLDDKIELNRRMNHTLEATAAAIFKSWFVDFDPVVAKAGGRQPFGMDAGTAALFPSEFVESELGPIPQGWRVGHIGDVLVQHKTSVTPAKLPGEIFDHLSIPAFDDGKTPTQEYGASIKSNKWIVPRGSVLVSKLNPIIPRVWWPVVHDSRQAICSTEFIVALPRQPFSTTYLYVLFSSAAFTDQFATYVTGTSNSHQRVRPRDLLDMNAFIPDVDCIQAFDAAVEPLLHRAHQTAAESAALSQLRNEHSSPQVDPPRCSQ